MTSGPVRAVAAVAAVMAFASAPSLAVGTGRDGRLAATVSPTATPYVNPRVPHWFKAPIGEPVFNVFCLSEQRCWVTTYLGVDYGPRPRSAVYITGDGGWTWERHDAGETVFPSGLFFVDQERGYTYRAHSTDGGRTWVELRIQGEQAGYVFATGGPTVYACGDSHPPTTWRSDDGGTTWVRWPAAWPAGCLPHGARFLDGDIAWATKEPAANRVLYTPDGWRTWREVEVVPQGAVMGIAFWDYSHGWAWAAGTPDGTLLYRTTDGGATWRPVPLPAPYAAVAGVAPAGPDDAVVAASDVSPAAARPTRRLDVLRTGNGGLSWDTEVLMAITEGSLSLRQVYAFNRNLAWLSIGISYGIGTPHYELYRRIPGLALTVTPTPTPSITPTITPTATLAPFTPVLPGSPTATPLAVTCPWEGDWAAEADGEAFTMHLNRNGNSVTGTYHGDRLLSGFAAGVTLAGRWAAPPTFTEPHNAGRFTFTMAADCQSFSGTWGFDTSAAGGGIWAGRRLPPAERLDMVRQAYLAVLGREPDPGGLQYWAGTTLPRATVEHALRASEEGQRVEAVRALYRELLLRDPLGPDNTGLRSWVDSGLTLEEVRAAMLGAPEVQRVLAVRALYRELLGREDDLEGIRYWVSTPLTIDQIRVAFMNSDEYRRRHPPG